MRCAGVGSRGGSAEEGELRGCIPPTDLLSAVIVLGTVPSPGNAALDKAETKIPPLVGFIV